MHTGIHLDLSLSCRNLEYSKLITFETSVPPKASETIL